MKNKFWIKKLIGILMIAPIAIAALGFIVMLLWNNVLVAVLGVKMITFWQALGLFLLSKILFGGWKGRGGGWRNRQWKEEWKAKWQNMTPEEKQKWKENMRNRCNTWGRPGRESYGKEDIREGRPGERDAFGNDADPAI